MYRPLRISAGSLVLAMVALGCGSKEPPRANVSGKVTFNGKMVTQGSVTFVSEDGTATDSGSIVDGVYKLTRAPIGKVKVGIVTPSNAGMKQAMKQKVEGKSFEGGGGPALELPVRFANADSSGLVLTIPAEGSTSLDIVIGK